MLKYILRRILIFIPTLIVISLLAFIISVNAPGDPVEQLTNAAPSGEGMNTQSRVQNEERVRIRNLLGLNLPVFYFSMTPSSFPDTLYKFSDKKVRSALKSFLNTYGNWERISAYHHSVRQLNSKISKIAIALDNPDREVFNKGLSDATFICRSLLATSDNTAIERKLKEVRAIFQQYSFPQPVLITQQHVVSDYASMKSNTQEWKNYLPSFHWYGNNQYHRWVFGDGNWITGSGAKYSKGFIRGDLGVSYLSRMPVNKIIWNRIGWSLFFTLLSVVIAYAVSIPIGIRAAAHRGSAFDHSSSILLFILHSMPTFWVGTLLLMTFANPDVLKWFPASGIKPDGGYSIGASFFVKMAESLPYLVLPAIAYTYSSLAFLSRIMRVSMLEVVQQDFIRTARANGLLEKSVIYKHAFRNALLPIITLFANILPAAIGGSVILEYIFTIPGMGLQTFQAIQQQDYPVIVGVFTMAGVLTLIGYLIADIFYAVADPRIKLSKSHS